MWRQQVFLHPCGCLEIIFYELVRRPQMIIDAFKLTILLGKPMLKTENAFTCPHTNTQFLGADRLTDKVIGPGVHTFHQVGLLCPRCAKDYVYIVLKLRGANPSTKIDARKIRHHPVAYDKTDF